MCCRAKSDVYAPVVLYAFNVVYAFSYFLFLYDIHREVRMLIFTHVLNALCLHTVHCE